MLGLTRTATAREVRRAYLQQAKAWHPDLQSHDRQALAADRFKGVVGAFELLSDPAQRERYDHALDMQARGGRGSAEAYAQHGPQTAEELKREVQAAVEKDLALRVQVGWLPRYVIVAGSAFSAALLAGHVPLASLMAEVTDPAMAVPVALAQVTGAIVTATVRTLKSG